VMTANTKSNVLSTSRASWWFGSRHNSLSKSDSELCADALAGFGDAIREGNAFTDLDDGARGIVASHADERALDFRTRTFDIGPSDCEFTAKALEWYARERADELGRSLMLKRLTDTGCVITKGPFRAFCVNTCHSFINEGEKSLRRRCFSRATETVSAGSSDLVFFGESPP